MYLSSDGSKIFESRPPADPEYNSYHPDPFEIDSLMIPVVSTLLSKGYHTRACCQGHLFSHAPKYYDELSKIFSSRSSSSKVPPLDTITRENRYFTTPYIMFEKRDMRKIDLSNLPDGWEPDYQHIKIDEDGNLMYYFNNIMTPRSEMKFTFGFSIRLSNDYVLHMMNKSKEELGEGFWWDNFDEYFKFYRIILTSLQELYDWACNLPRNHK